MFFLQMAGVPGSGKSTLASEIAKSTNAIILDLDIIKASMLNTYKSDDKEIDFKYAGRVSYDIMFALADYYLSQMRSVIIDSPCYYEVLLDRGIELSKKHNAKYKYIECKIEDLEEIDKRLQERHSLSSQKKSVYNEDGSKFEDFEKWLKGNVRPNEEDFLVLDTSKGVETYLQDAENYIKR